MALIIVLSLLVCLVGLVTYLICIGATKASFAEIGRIMFFAGLLAFLMGAVGQMGGCSVGTSPPVHVR